MKAAIVALAAILSLDVKTCTLVTLEPPHPDCVAISFPPIELVKTSDGRYVTVFSQAGTYLVYWLWIENGQIRWSQEQVVAKSDTPNPPPPGPQPQPEPPRPAPTNIAVLWIEESSVRTPKMAEMQIELRKRLEAKRVSFGVVDADNPVSYIQSLVKEITGQISGIDLRKAPVLVIVRSNSSQVLAALVISESHTVDQLVEWIEKRSRERASNNQMGRGGADRYNWAGYEGGRSAQPVFCPIPGACPVSP